MDDLHCRPPLPACDAPRRFEVSMSNGRISSQIDPEDMFADTRMSFGDHLEDLRAHLWRAVKGFLLAMILSLCFGKYVVVFITAPVEKQLHNFYDRASKKTRQELMDKAEREGGVAVKKRWKVEIDPNALRAAVGLPPRPRPLLGNIVDAFERRLEELDVGHMIDRANLEEDSGFVTLELATNDPRFLANMAEIARKYGPPQSVATMNVTEAFMVYFKVSLVTGLVLGSPWIFYQIWAFIAAGLYPHEKRLVNVYLPFSLGLFLAGAAVCQFLVMPKAIDVLLSFNEWMGLEPDMRLNEWLSFALMMPLIFGVSFQTPLVMLFMFKIGIADVSTFTGYRKIAIFVLAVFAAVITPTPDALTMCFLWIPMCLLYELGIIMCALQPKTPFEDVETPQAEEMVEV
jgi:sec-independent protein translocase protein TatC